VPPPRCRFAAAVPPFAQRLIDAFWPGPLTLILPRQPGVAGAAAGGQPTGRPALPGAPGGAGAAGGLRGARRAWPGGAQRQPLRPRQPHHGAARGGRVGDELLVLDGGPCAVGIESTIVDCTRGAPVLLRPGQLARADIERAAGQRLRTATSWARPTPRPRARWPRTTRRARACA
jgi:L-threonylcarbamoyladenylate synthase